MNIFYLKNIFYEHSKNEKLNYLQTVKIDSSTYSPHLGKELQLVQKMKISQLFVVPPENEEFLFIIGLVSLTCPK
jgi:poly-D-alanine transfer protein DltD